MGKLADYAARIGPIRDRYQEEFAALEAAWVASRQAVIDRVEDAVPGADLAHDGLIDFLSTPIDAAHELAVAGLFENYTRAAEDIRREVGL